MASLMLHMPRRSLLRVHRILLQMIRQDFVIVSNVKFASKKPSLKLPDDSERNHVWEVRHAGLLGIKYEVAVRSDIFDNTGGVKEEGGGVTPDQEGMEILRDVVDAAILGYVGHIHQAHPLNYVFVGSVIETTMYGPSRRHVCSRWHNIWLIIYLNLLSVSWWCYGIVLVT